jgi:RNA polymerase sigma-70 factor (ECF subfamily)
MTLFREEVAALVPHLRAFARTLAAGDASFADDLVQDTMVNALQAQRQFSKGTNLKAWLFTILRNRWRSLLGRRHVSAEISVEGLDQLAWAPPQQEVLLEVIAFRAAFRRLTPAQREVLVLVAVQGLSYERAAEVCGCELGTVKSRVHRARALLREMLLDVDGRAAEDEVRPERRPPAAAWHNQRPEFAR